MAAFYRFLIHLKSDKNLLFQKFKIKIENKTCNTSMILYNDDPSRDESSFIAN